MKHQEDKAENINLVSPTIYIEQIIKAVKIARDQGLKLPIIYNSNAYENVESLKKLEGVIDVYLPDLKYSDDKLALKYSKINNYFEFATKAIKEMERQVGSPIFNEKQMIQRGLIVRHLIMPSQIDNTKKVLNWFKENMKETTYISIMAQYFPTYKANEYEEINRKLNKEEYEEIENYINELNIQNGYMQDFLEEDEKQYVPKWDY